MEVKYLTASSSGVRLRSWAQSSHFELDSLWDRQTTLMAEAVSVHFGFGCDPPVYNPEGIRVPTVSLRAFCRRSMRALSQSLMSVCVSDMVGERDMLESSALST